MADQAKELERAFRALKQALKAANIEALEQDAFGTSRELTGIMEQLARLQAHAVSLYTGAPALAPTAPAPALSEDATYPRFFRTGSTLYKEGLRQDGESIYVQKVDRSAFEEIFRSITGQNRRFKPAKLIKEGAHPSYQVYILLNVMQEAGLVENPERGVYRLTPQAKQYDPPGFWKAIEERTAH
ncbi:hypothetical protein HFP89_08080 [Wenzhouxiangella sp. XN79A]|uniref:hypothetical protein n=1 Tax=Wenzhouxiangella sp. XN79A TaxID=2724193 RepID=UPI00144A85C6|nr:hypothetical protein [Wenzhouxiangella sp. XN79A]NKI35122.1 hypothetical protein [Wenzhouxiangella sp. XN79A]